MNDADSRRAADAISHAASAIQYAFQSTVNSYGEFSIMLRPKVFRDGNKWCALYGEDIQEGVCGFGDSPRAALTAFDVAMRTPLTPDEKNV